MNVLLNNKSGTPIYEQIYNQLKSQIISGVLAEDEPLPSIRSLAKDLRISVITTKRAYDELEKEGFIYTVAGKGTFVKLKHIDTIKERYVTDRLNELKDKLDAMKKSGISRADIITVVEEVFGKK